MPFLCCFPFFQQLRARPIRTNSAARILFQVFPGFFFFQVLRGRIGSMLEGTLTMRTGNNTDDETSAIVSWHCIGHLSFDRKIPPQVMKGQPKELRPWITHSHTCRIDHNQLVRSWDQQVEICHGSHRWSIEVKQSKVGQSRAKQGKAGQSRAKQGKSGQSGAIQVAVLTTSSRVNQSKIDPRSTCLAIGVIHQLSAASSDGRCVVAFFSLFFFFFFFLIFHSLFIFFYFSFSVQYVSSCCS